MLQIFAQMLQEKINDQKYLDCLEDYFKSQPIEDFIKFLDILPHSLIIRNKKFRVLSKRIFANRGAAAIESIIVQGKTFFGSGEKDENFMLEFHKLAKTW